MVFWITAALFTAIAVLAVVTPLYRRGTRAEPVVDEAQDVAVYRDQLAEIETDLNRGVIGAAEAEAARIEISRRLLKASAEEKSAATDNRKPSAQRIRFAAIAGALAIPVLSFGLYYELGSPNMPDQPRAARLDRPIEQQDIMALIAKVEERLAANPEEGEGWELLGRVYMRIGRYDKAIEVWPKAIRLLGTSVEREANLGESLVMANDGIVTDEAVAAFNRASALDPQAIKPRFFLAVALGQDGKMEEAAVAWKAIIAAARGDEPWLPAVRRELAAVEESLGGTPATGTEGGAGTGQTAVPSVDQMVQSLAARLKDDPNDPQGWVMLIRSYRVLGRGDEVDKAIADARTALKDNSDGLSAFEAALAGDTGSAPETAANAPPPG
ncbi:MAG: c-type cytochrome biogenesis protein CcmI, partial [Hyphomicrobiales bacterium]|nr:c-type cytochrome biogenesis protein CcmI [Hyphomicrobiales bacterium]